MKKFLVIVAGMGIVLAFSSCKSKESAYRQAYDKAKAQEAAITTENNVYEDTPEVTPFVDTPYIDNTGSQDQNYDNVPVRQEDVSVVGGGALKAYSVVVGSFSVKSNADGLVSRLRQRGYDAQLAYNSARNMYRVVATTYNDKGSAVQSRTKLRGEFPDAWLLYYGR
ncbi:MAG: SPOR domain-containing protein [Prevotella sp.]|nr:SPOR domain-containing protein [Prevotella sp.]